jgi:hypothetical protein
VLTGQSIHYMLRLKINQIGRLTGAARRDLHGVDSVCGQDGVAGQCSTQEEDEPVLPLQLLFVHR